MAWVAGAGYLMGFTVLQLIFKAPRVSHLAAWQVGVVALAPALLSAGVAMASQLARRWPTVFLVSAASALVTALVCSPLCYVLLRAAGGSLMTGERMIGTLVLVSMFGSFIAMPLGLAFGLVYGVVLSALAALRGRAANAGIDAALTLAGFAWVGVGIACALVSQLLTAHGVAAEETRTLSWSWVLLGAATCTVGVARWELRQRFVARVRAGHVDGWTVLPADAIQKAESVPPLFPFGPTDAVLVRRQQSTAGAFRSGELLLPVARVGGLRPDRPAPDCSS